ncbi:hypothetical protein Despr_3350 [Desulfobulbus propionicus DSM 2032]|jgi:hypothetical protein|uniref:DUF4412 domain-containing protein n=1 Tax=Desulfobulbus propionicus (strain ATCC 33891 / DSM 2032 / VKM B-1956 / 1pr3) TaxID=577650 RepID=A0A7U3YQE7_DESPD|nr:hypothetical protein [Desulfobulbus propionicus]ADW19476.1 hypothetical protein Despr_3350 [Desulfobulbus propionicus DSM 2032]
MIFKRKLLILPLSLLVVHAPAWADDLPWEKKLPFKQATIHYELTGSEQGKDTLYIKEYGKIRAKYHTATTTIMGETTKADTIEITDPDWITTYDLIEQKGEKTTNPSKIYQAEYNKLSAEEKKNFERNATELGAGLATNFGGSVTQKSEKLMGYDCDVATVGGMSTVFLLHGSDIPLKSEVSMMGVKNLNLATKIDTDSAIPDRVFAPPAGIVAERNPEMENMMSGTIQHMVATLKKPDGAKEIQQAGPMGMMGTGGMEQMMRQGMENEGMSKEEQEEAMRQMQEAMQQLKPQQ